MNKTNFIISLIIFSLSASLGAESKFKVSDQITGIMQEIVKEPKLSKKEKDVLLKVIQKVKIAQEKKAVEAKKIKQQKIQAYNAQGVCSMWATDEWAKNFRTAYEKNPELKEVKAKKEVTVAILDTGVDYRNYFLKKAIPEKYSMEKLNFTEDVPFDTNGHGTHVAGIILAVMPQAKILPLKVFHDRKGRASEIVKGLKFAIKQKVDIINLSLEGDEPLEEELALLKKAEKQGIIIVTAAGNGQQNLAKEFAFPASYQLNQIVVGNSTANDEVSPSSNYGQTVDFLIRGTRVKSLGLDCESRMMTGTSQSTPVIAGIVAKLKATHPNITLNEIKAHLASLSKKNETHDKSKHGFLSLSEALNAEFSGAYPRTVSSSK